MTQVAYRFKPRRGASFHFGLEGLDHETSVEMFPSDSLFAALISAMAEYDGIEDTAKFLSEWPTEHGDGIMPPFSLSSLFPYVGELLLFPMPRIRVNINDLPAPGVAKFLKKVKYVSPSILDRLLSNEDMVDWLPDSGKRGSVLQNGKIWISAQEKELLPRKWRNDSESALQHRPVWKNGTSPHVTVDRMSNSGSIYLVGRTSFGDECGLWMLADVDSHRETLERLLEQLQDRGIGGRRSTGHGAFELDRIADAPELPASTDCSRVMTLSRYNPTPSEIEAGVLGADASYELVDVGGWMWSTQSAAQRRKRVRMIEAGSILEARKPVVGRLVDVRPEYDQPGAPEHPVYRSGVALTIGVKAAKGGQHG